jgi:hypothetical protein
VLAGKGEQAKKRPKGKKAKKRKQSSSSSSEEEEKKEKRQRKKKKKVSISETSSDSDSSKGSGSSSSAGSSEQHSSSSTSSSSSSDSESSGGDSRRKKKKRKDRKKKDKCTIDMDLLEELWPAEDRPAKLRSKKGVAKYKKMSKLLQLKEQFVIERQKKGIGSVLFGKDRKPKSKKFKAMKDDGEKKLHPARFIGLPRVDPGQYWSQVPMETSEIYRHLPLQHLGVEGVQESTIVKMHNRRVPVEMEGLWKDCKDLKQVQLAMFNYIAVLRSLHPGDYSGLVMQRVLIEAGWGEHFGTNDKQRVGLARRFFDDVVRENSGRAVRQEPPLDYEQVKARWMKAVAAVFPQFSLLQLGQQLAVAGANQKPDNGGNSGGAQRGQRGQGGGQRGSVPAGGVLRTPARYNGLPVCFAYNSKEGCKRPPQGAMACKDGGSVFAHVCNYMMKGVGGQPDKHCLAHHPRFGNH